MSSSLLDLCSDYLISSFGQTSAADTILPLSTVRQRLERFAGTAVLY